MNLLAPRLQVGPARPAALNRANAAGIKAGLAPRRQERVAAAAAKRTVATQRLAAQQARRGAARRGVSKSVKLC